MSRAYFRPAAPPAGAMRRPAVCGVLCVLRAAALPSSIHPIPSLYNPAQPAMRAAPLSLNSTAVRQTPLTLRPRRWRPAAAPETCRSARAWAPRQRPPAAATAEATAAARQQQAAAAAAQQQPPAAEAAALQRPPAVAQHAAAAVAPQPAAAAALAGHSEASPPRAQRLPRAAAPPQRAQPPASRQPQRWQPMPPQQQPRKRRAGRRPRG